MDAKSRGALSRRTFLKIGGAAVAGSTLSLTGTSCQKQDESRIKEYRTLGRTGFKASDISFGGDPATTEVVRYAYDKGINYFDTAESYLGGDAERRIGKAMQFMDRSKIFITTKLKFGMDETERNIIDRYRKCLERMQTDYADALSIHAADNSQIVKHEGFHSAVEKLKAEGRVKHAGLSCHGPEEEGAESMESVLTTAIEDGRFDLLLMSYNFLNEVEAERVLAASKARNIGTTAMKTSPGLIEIETFDPDNPTETQEYLLWRFDKEGFSKKEAIERIHDTLKDQERIREKIVPFAKKYGVVSNEELRKVCAQWVLSNQDMHTVGITVVGFKEIDMFVPLSGTKVDQEAIDFLNDFQLAYGSQYCRHGCNQCAANCAHRLPVSRIMRYSYYFTLQGREKYAMSKYRELKDKNASRCVTCEAPCTGTCPYGVNIQANLASAHSLLKLG
jgi:predicted aldo/keto reductase-like oxidoreductase